MSALSPRPAALRTPLLRPRKGAARRRMGATCFASRFLRLAELRPARPRFSRLNWPFPRPKLAAVKGVARPMLEAGSGVEADL